MPRYFFQAKLWKESSRFLESTLMTKWDDLEEKGRRESQQFSRYFKKQYLDDLRNKIASFVM